MHTESSEKQTGKPDCMPRTRSGYSHQKDTCFCHLGPISERFHHLHDSVRNWRSSIKYSSSILQGTFHTQTRATTNLNTKSFHVFCCVFFFWDSNVNDLKYIWKNIWSLWYYSMVPSQWCPYSMAYPPYFLRKIKLTQISGLLDTCNLFLK